MPSLKENGSSSVSECDLKSSMVDEKKMKRMISNRESARRSRKRKQEQLHKLTEEVGMLQAAIFGTRRKIDGIMEKNMILDTENSVMRAQEKELWERLKSLNDLIESSGLGVDDNQFTGPMLESWQLPFPMQVIHASSGLHF